MFRKLVLLVPLCCLTATLNFAQQAANPTGAADAASKSDKATASKAPVRMKEDWSKLTVDRNVLRPLVAGASLGKVDTAHCTRELIRLEWRHGDPIDIYVLTPRSGDKPRVVLYLYSFPADTDRFMDDAWCQRNVRPGLAAVGFASALTAQRYRNRPMKEWFISELQESMASSAHDVQLILDYLASRGDLSVEQVGMFGQGSGGSIAVLAAAADPRIKALDLLNPWGDWPDWLKTSPVVPDEERARYLTPEFLAKAACVDPVAFLPQLKDRAVRVQQVMDDTDTPDAAKQKIAAATPTGDLAQFKDQAAHAVSWKATGLSGWIATQLGLKPQSAATTAAKVQP